MVRRVVAVTVFSLLVAPAALSAPGSPVGGWPVPPFLEAEEAVPATAQTSSTAQQTCISNAQLPSYTLVLCVSHKLRAPFAARTFANYACRGEMKGPGFLKQYSASSNISRVFRACINAKANAALKRLTREQARASSQGCLELIRAGAVLQEAKYTTPRGFTIYSVRGTC